MADVATLIDVVCRDTGLDDSPGAGGERDVALSALNESYEIILSELQLNVDEGSVALTAGQFKYDIISDLGLSSVFVFNSFWLNDDSAQNEPMQRIKMEKMRKLLAGADLINSVPHFYSIRGKKLWISPPPDSDAVLFFEFVESTPELVEGAAGAGQENVPSFFPNEFHKSVLARKAISIILNGYEGREEVAQVHDAIAERSMQRLKAWTVRYGGVEGPRDTPKDTTFFRGNDVY